MANAIIKLSDWTDYLESRVGVDVYVWGGNGELIVTLLPKLVDMEKSDHTDKEALTNIKRTNTLLQKRLLQKIDIYIIRGVDCSGLGVKFLLDKGVISYDMTANAMYNYIVGTKKTKAHGKKISLDKVKAGDFLFDGSDSNKWHVGYAVSDKYAVESKSHDDGVVKTCIANRSWKYAARPDWYESTPSVFVLTRELYFTDPMMRGDDVTQLQKRLTELKYNCGSIDGAFGNKTSIAVKNFQSDKKLTVDGVVGKNTALALGFAWEG